MSVLVVIVNYRTPGLTIDCLKSLAQEIARVPGARCVIADNLSPDDSVPQIAQAIKDLGFSDWCTLVPLPKNGGFAYGNNEAIRASLPLPAGEGWGEGACSDLTHSLQSSPAAPTLSQHEAEHDCDLIWLLNPDTIVLTGALVELVDFMNAHPTVGIAGGRAVNRDDTVRRSSFRFHSPLGELENALQISLVSKLLRKHVVAPPIPNQAARVDWVSGASMMVRKEVFDKIGLLDDGYFMYFEETDFCLKASRAGFACWYVPTSRIIHLVGQSSGVTGAQRGLKRRPKYWFNSRRRYFISNFGRCTFHTASLLWLLTYPIGRLWLRLRRKRRDDPPMLWRDFLRYNYFPCNRP